MQTIRNDKAKQAHQWLKRNNMGKQRGRNTVNPTLCRGHDRINQFIAPFMPRPPRLRRKLVGHGALPTPCAWP